MTFEMKLADEREKVRQEVILEDRIMFFHSLRDTTDWTEERILDTIGIPENEREEFLKIIAQQPSTMEE